MQITVTRDELATAIAWAVRHLSRRPVAPVLAGMRLEVAGGRLLISVSDYETSARISVPGRHAEDGVLLVEGRPLAATIKSLPKAKSARVLLASVDETGELKVYCEGTTSPVAGLPLDEYPALPALPVVSGLVDGAAFKRSIARVAAAAGRDDTLPVLTCILMQPGADAITLAATDRYRLAADAMPWTPAVGGDGEYLVPWKTAAEFAKAATGKVAVHFGDQQAGGDAIVGFSDDIRSLTTRTVSGQFPKYKPLIPKKHATTVTADAAQLADVVKTCAGLSDGAVVRLLVGDGKVTMQGFRGEQVSAERVVAAAVDGDELAISFNGSRLASVIGGVKGAARIGFNGNRKPALITASPEAELDPFIGIVMPTPEHVEPTPAPESPEPAAQVES